MGIIKQNGIEYKVSYGILRGWEGESEFKKPILSDGVIIEGWNGLEEINILKLSKIEQLNNNSNAALKPTDFYITREITFQKSNKSKAKKDAKLMPPEVVTARIATHDLVDLKELEINAITDYQELINYDVSL